jgi:hypothetical protein
LIAPTAAPTMPHPTAVADTSMTKKKEGGIGARTMYSAGATHSTLPWDSSGWVPQSRRAPVAGSREQ